MDNPQFTKLDIEISASDAAEEDIDRMTAAIAIRVTGDGC